MSDAFNQKSSFMIHSDLTRVEERDGVKLNTIISTFLIDKLLDLFSFLLFTQANDK